MEINKRFQLYAWVALGYNVLVVLWGAFVRASGSGAGCGAHWPLCNGQVIPQSPRVATLIEFIHRGMSGISLIVIFSLLVWAWRAYPKKHPVRLGAVLCSVFIVTEALVGAALVLFQWVGMNQSVGRTVSVAIHLVNTFLLLASLTLTAWWASGGRALRLSGQGAVLVVLGLALFGVLTLGVTGSINALGDTLFPATSLAAGVQQDFTPGSSFLLRLRVLHPLIAASVGIYTIVLVTYLHYSRQDHAVKRFSYILGSVVVLQLTAGLINLFLLAPVYMQLIHLLLADLLWISLVLLTASILNSGTKTGYQTLVMEGEKAQHESFGTETSG